MLYVRGTMKYLDCCCPRRIHTSQQERSFPPPPSPPPPSSSSSLGPLSLSPRSSATHSPSVTIEDSLQAQAEEHCTVKHTMEEPPTEEEDISTTAIADDPFRPMLRRGRKYSADALRNGAVRMKSTRQPPISSRDIYWVEKSNSKEMQENNRQKRVTFTPAIPPPSWSRFPSHSRAERSCSSAGKEDHVYARDFAFEPRVGDPSGVGGGDKEEEGEQGRWKKYRRHTFEKSMVRKLHRYHRTSLRPTRSGFRSSISVGGVLEYPELAILPSLEAVPLASRAVSPQLGLFGDDGENPESHPGIINNSSSLSNPPDAGLGPDRATIDGARNWSRIYEGCLLPRPTTSDEMPTKDFTSAAFLRPDHASRHSRQLSENRRLSARSSTEMRSSTVDFQKSLEEYEMRARERALQAASDASLRRVKEGG